MVQMITDKLEMDDSIAVRLIPPQWSEKDEKIPLLFRCDSEQAAKQVHDHLQFALNYYSERKHCALSVRTLDADEFTAKQVTRTL